MILRYGNTDSLAGTSWFTVELRSPRTAESTLRRLGTHIPMIFKDESGVVTPVEVFIPLVSRDLDEFEICTSNYLFVRSKNFYGLLRLKTITGIVGLLTFGDSNRPSNAIPTSDEDVQRLVRDSEELFAKRTDGMKVGSFARILDGPTRDWCGTIISLSDGLACIQVQMKTKVLLVETPLRNLKNLSHVPPALRVFYYAPLLNVLEETGDTHLIAEDINYEEDSLYSDDGLEVKKPTKHGRQQTVTALVKRQIFSGVLKPLDIAREITRALEAGEVRPPKNLSIVAGIIKTHLINDHFALLNPEIKNYIDVIQAYGSDYRFTVQEIADLSDRLEIPRKTTEACTDGRSSDARQRRKEAA